MKKLWDLAKENLINVQGSYGILDQYYGRQLYPKHGQLSVNQLKNDSCG